MTTANNRSTQPVASRSVGVAMRRYWHMIQNRRYFVPLCLILILLVGSYFRFLGVNWDDYTHLHPDERHIWMVTISLSLPKSMGEYFNTAVSPLNPYNKGSSFIYGTFPLFLTKALGELLNQGHPDRIHLLGRMLAATFDLVSVFLMFLIGRKLYGERVGLLSAFLTACLVIHIQQSHFYSADSFVATFVLLTFYWSLRVAERGSWSDFVWMGASYGLAVASKINVALFGAVMALACAMRVYKAVLAPVADSASAKRSVAASAPVHSMDQQPSGALFSWRRTIGALGLNLSVERPPGTGVARVVNNPGPVVVANPAVDLSRQQPHWLEIGYKVAAKFALCLVVAFFTFRIVQPYSFQGPGFFDLRLADAWLNDVRYWSKAAAGLIDLPFNHQWTSRAPVLFSLQNMVLWAVGVPLGLASWAAWAFAWYELLRKRKLQHTLVLVWTTFFFLYQSTRFGKLSRYLTPFFPFMAMLAAYLLVHAWDRARTLKVRWAKPAAAGLALSVLVGTFLWAFAFTRIYTRPLTRVAASLWVYDNIPAGSAIGNEHWDDAIPWGGVGGRNGYADGTYEYVEFHPYAEDEPIKLEWFMDWLGQADYIILSSNRLYGSIPRLPMRFPMTTRYYKYLFNGELGFERIRTFTSRPNLGPIEFNDDNAEEPFTVYDHPRVDIFKKTEDFSLEKARRLLGEGIDWDNIARLMPIEVPAFKNGLQMTDQETQIQRSGGTWSEIFNRNSLSNMVPVFFWLLLVELLGVVTFPLADRIFRSLPDHGYILSKTLGILLLTWLTWMMVNLGWMFYTRATIGVALLFLTACSALIFWCRREAMLAFWRRNRRLIVINEALFLGFFFLFLLIRYGNPDLWHPVMGGEKPMDFAYLNAVIKSSIFPPYDPWYAGGYLNYYYFGQIIVATLTNLTGIVPWVAYNLAIPLFAALTAMGAFSIAYNLTAKRDEQWTGWWRPALSWGLAAALMAAVLGNLAEIGVWLKALADLGTVDARSSLPYVADLARVLSGLARWLTGKARPAIRPEWPYWNPSRVMPHGEINEFPFFTFLYADLHAHLIGLPFTLLALGLSVEALRRKAQPLLQGAEQAFDLGRVTASVQSLWSNFVMRVDWSELWLLAALGLAVGALRPINSWDYPTYLLIAIAALALREYEHRQRIDLAGLAAVAWRAVVVLVLSILFFQPFLSRFTTAYTSVMRWRGERTGLGAYLVIHGLFLFIILSYMAVELFGRQARRGVTRMLRLSLHYWDRVPRLLHLYRLLVEEGRQFDRAASLVAAAVAVVLAVPILAREWFDLFIVVLILGTLLVVLRWRMEPRRRFIWLLFGVGLALSLAVEFIVLKGDIGRMNTVFKFYLQIWVLWSVVAAVSLSHLSERLQHWSADRRRVWLGILALLVFLAALYPVFATRAKINDRFDPQVGPTLDGMAYMTRAVYYDGEPIELKWDYDAINWLLDNVQGSPVIAEANTEPRGLYRWGSRISIYTGLPTIIGWSWHQRQQRSAMPDQWVSQRLDDVQRLYTDPDPEVAMELLRKYEVRYIYVGDVERIYYPGTGLEKFELMRAQGLLDLVYHNERVRIYQVVEP
jgi:YYY domain-containing protein